MEEIYRIGTRKTLIVVTHRPATLEGCDRVCRLERGRIAECRAPSSPLSRNDRKTRTVPGGNGTP
jgi:ABC-type transport system involved in cytochrome bd biosynthesis fused ATPase/permease subunit